MSLEGREQMNEMALALPNRQTALSSRRTSISGVTTASPLWLSSPSFPSLADCRLLRAAAMCVLALLLVSAPLVATSSDEVMLSLSFSFSFSFSFSHLSVLSHFPFLNSKKLHIILAISVVISS